MHVPFKDSALPFKQTNMTKSIKSRKIGNAEPVIKEHVITQTRKLHESVYTQFPLIPEPQIIGIIAHKTHASFKDSALPCK